MFLNVDLKQFIFGRLSLEAIPYDEPILLGTFIVVGLGGAAVLGAVTWYGQWGYLWREWFTTMDHKKIGIMYIILAIVMLLRGFADAVMMITQKAVAVGASEGYLPPHHYDQIFTAHGTIMIFFMAMPFVVGVMNFVMPLQIGARDVAFPFLNNFSFWMTVGGAALTMLSLFVGEFSRATWLGYAPLSGAAYSPGVGVDYYIWSLQVAGVGTTLSGINLIATIIKLRAPGMTIMKMPVFCWTTLASNAIIITIFPVLTATLALLALDRYVGTHFFTNDFGGNSMFYMNLIWIWGHPEVYVLVLPAFGIYSEVVSTFCSKRLFGYTSMVYATAVIALVSWLVWLHHFFTMGGGPNVNSFFGMASMIIAIPTGAKVFNWLFTMYRGKIRFEGPFIWVMGFIPTFVIGGLTGVLLAVPPADFVVHNSLFLVAHFHNVIIGGVVFGLLAGIQYWFPKAFGYKLDPFWNKVSFWCWLIGFWTVFTPLYILGLMGETRRTQHFDDSAVQPFLMVAAIGVFIIMAGIAAFVFQLLISYLRRDQLRDLSGDPWGGRTLEWATSSPPPPYNFAFTPVIHDLDAWWDMKKRGYNRPLGGFRPIHMPKNTGAGMVLAGLSTVLAFALIWYIWWLATVSFVALIAAAIIHTFNYDREYYLPLEEVVRVESHRTAQLLAAGT
jgi:cytochrome o ubiquinol oxidase subunit I